MALDLAKLNIFKRLGPRARIFVLVGVVIGFLFLVYLGTKMLSGGGSTTIGPSRVANVPSGLQSVPGGQLTPEYSRQLQESNIQTAQQAQATGGSYIPTMIRNNDQNAGSTCVVCTEDSANVSTLLDAWARQGKVSPDLADTLQKLASKNVAVDEYATELDKLVKAGKLSPEQARQLLDQYKKQHANAQLQESAKTMDDFIKSNQMSLSVANDLLTTQKSKPSPADYAAKLQQMVRDGKISPDVAQRLLAQYTQQYTNDVIGQSIATLNGMANAGQISPDILKDLISLENQMVPLNTVSDTLKKYVAAGKLIPAISDKILEEYKQQKAAIGSTGSVGTLLQQAEAAAYQEISDLLKARKISPDVADQLRNMIQQNVSLDVFKGTVGELVKQNKLTPDIAKLKIQDYTIVKNLRDMMGRLSDLQANNASPSQYADELKRAVQTGALTPDQAAQLMQEYQTMLASKAPIATPIATIQGSADFAELQRRAQQGAATSPAKVTASQFTAVQTKTEQANDQERQARLQALSSAMAGQAGQLISAWQPPGMAHVEGSWSKQARTPASEKASDGKSSNGESGSSTGSSSSGAPLVKAGSILFAVLDTAVNSDYPDSPVMATIVLGPYKGAKLLGKLSTTKGVSGQMDRVSLNFTMMNTDEWIKSKSVTAYAIDPDTARTVLASQVNYHYLQRFGAMFATSFLQGYATAITTSSSSSTTGIFGTSTTHPALSPSQKMAVALGQVGQSLGQATQNYINRPPTVKVDSGVSLGILFMADVT